MIQRELAAIAQRPGDVGVGLEGLLAILDEVEQALRFQAAGPPGQEHQEQLLDHLPWRLVRRDQFLEQRILPRPELRRVHHPEKLRDAARVLQRAGAVGGAEEADEFFALAFSPRVGGRLGKERERHQRIEQLLGRQQTDGPVADQLRVTLVAVRGKAAALVGLAVADGPDEVFQVETILRELIGEGLQQLRMGWRAVQIVHRVGRRDGPRCG